MIRARAVRKPDEAGMLKFPRTIRLHPSDTFVFEQAAEPGEWAVSGAFVFWNQDPASLGQKQRVALRSGFLGIHSLARGSRASPATVSARAAPARPLAGRGGCAGVVSERSPAAGPQCATGEPWSLGA